MGVVQEVSISRAEGAGVVVEEFSQVRRGQIMEGFVGHEKEFEVDSLGDGEPVELWRTGVMWSQVPEWVSRRAAGFWMYWSLLRVFEGEP